MSDRFRVRMLGGFRVYRDDRVLQLPPSCRRLVARVALRRQPVHRMWLRSTLWPDAPPSKSAASLRSALWRLRPLGAEDLLDVDPQYVALADGVSVDWRDAVDLSQRLLQRCEPLDQEVVAALLPLLRAGDLLDGWTDPWTTHERGRYRALRSAALDALMRSSADRGGQPHGSWATCAGRLSTDPAE